MAGHVAVQSTFPLALTSGVCWPNTHSDLCNRSGQTHRFDRAQTGSTKSFVTGALMQAL